MLSMCELAVRGGVSQSSNRFFQANNPYLEADKYDASKDDTYLLYIECNNLYGAAMSQSLPIGAFKWVESVQQRLQKNPDFCEQMRKTVRLIIF